MDESQQQWISGISTSYLIGDPLIDGEHAALLGLLQELQASASADAKHDDFLAKFGRLGCDLARHFVHEEALMQSIAMPLPLIEEHVLAHQRIVESYLAINIDLMRGKAYQKEELFPMIRGWILDHIQASDLKIKRFISQSYGDSA